ncbi:MAG TPA: UDP-N-acetylmuramoyl-L-alanyl-D-glutamate--2,6-diaminopimelate ligase, partial [Methylomirabilota bacterium]|nr:UDP-N-acetylmuramoyl-L-alanyl-D-glutamate--2,6-diaminopimelate ligase [Methylomirabilota bacterium]
RAIVAEPPDPLPGRPVGRILVPDSRWALPRLADAYYGHPSQALTVVGITGTNGKTTTSYLVEALLRARGLATGVIGTIQYVIRGEAREAHQTTPDALTLQGLLAEMVAAGVGGVAMEVSSHALEQRRVDGIAFDVAVFTNLTQDHLDFHGTMDAYAAAKRRLFVQLLPDGGKPGATAVLNADDPVGAAWARTLPTRVLTFGMGVTGTGDPGALAGDRSAPRDVRPRRYRSGLRGIELSADTPLGPVHVASPLIGEHNVMNLLGAVATGVALSLEPAAIGAALGAVATVPGRFERVEAGQDFLVVVDYAHTPDALRRVLETARRLTPGRLGVVFGAGGDRDRGKRPLMGRIAAELAHRVWLTSDNPRSEDPVAIIREIAAGVEPPPPGGYTEIPDRREAIEAALAWAGAGDTIVIAGKGHETYQIIAGQVLPFDDRSIARHALSGTGAPPR